MSWGFIYISEIHISFEKETSEFTPHGAFVPQLFPICTFNLKFSISFLLRPFSFLLFSFLSFHIIFCQIASPDISQN
jgi:hypothetical protein